MHQTVCGETCIVCNEQKQLGIHIYGQFICEACEREIVQTDVKESNYDYYIQRLKRIWLEAML